MMPMTAPAIQNPAPPEVERLCERVQRHSVDGAGGRVVWRTLGQGRPLVLLHGGHGAWLHWVRNMQALAENRTVCVPDMPGYGDSDAPADDSMERLLQGLGQSLDMLLGQGVDFDLVGFSFGGLVASHLAVVRGGVRRLALLGTAGHGGVRRPRAELRNWREAALHGDVSALAETMRHNLLAHMLHHPHSVDATALYLHTQACLRTRFRSKPLSRAGGLQSLLPRAADALLLAWGEHDVTAEPSQAAAHLSACHPRARTAVLPGAGHWVQYESPDAVNRLLRGWLDHQSPCERDVDHVRN